MSLFAIKNNPFDAYGAGWEGASGRALPAATAAAEAATDVLIETLQERGSKLGAFPQEALAEVQAAPDKAGRWQVGVPDDSPHAAAARAAEYGTDEQGPTGLMRSAERKAKVEAEQVFTDTLTEELFG